MLTVGAGDVVAGVFVWMTVCVTVGAAAGVRERLPHPARAKTVSAAAAPLVMMMVLMAAPSGGLSLGPARRTPGHTPHVTRWPWPRRAVTVTSMNGGQWMTRLSESTARRYGKVFDEMAAEYDRHRPTYPDELVDQACRVAGIGSGDHVLEVGCGSGQLTRGLVARGLHVTALEPGKSLIALARQNLEGAGEVEFVNDQFEVALLPREQFQAVFSASAFHWVDAKVSWQKAADVLVTGGTLALVQYCG